MDGQISVAHDEGIYAFALQGDIRMVLCLTFDKYLMDMFDDDALEQVIFDLRPAEAIDSTTLGLMAKVALRCEALELTTPVLVADDASMLRLLESMGLDEIFLISGHHESVLQCDQQLHCEGGCEDTYKEQVLEAHRILMSLNDDNHQAFKPLIESLDPGSV